MFNQTNKGINAKGVPEGMKYEKKCNLWILKPKIVTPVQIVKLKPIATIAEVVIVKLRKGFYCVAAEPYIKKRPGLGFNKVNVFIATRPIYFDDIERKKFT